VAMRASRGMDGGCGAWMGKAVAIWVGAFMTRVLRYVKK
jgi:hypothetical protein